jgi:hypothetical protein
MFCLFVLILSLLCGCDDAASLVSLPSVTCTNGSIITLTVKYAPLIVDDVVHFNSRLFVYNGTASHPAPTIRMKAGTTCTVRIENELATTSAVSQCDYHSNTFHCPDTTNLHTHGLHVSPTEDDINTTVLPGTYRDYTYTLPSDHLMGTFWYHAHKHGSAALHVGGGLAGMLVMEASDDYTLPDDLSLLYYSSSKKELVLHHINFAGTDECVSDAFTMMDYQAISDNYTTVNEGIQTVDPSPVWSSAFSSTSNRSFYIVNGQYQPTTTITANHATLFAIVNTGITRIIELTLSDNKKYCSMQLIARDGIFQYTPYPSISAIVIPPAGRADVAILCSSNGVGQTIVVKSYPDPSRTSLLEQLNRHTQNNVFSIQIVSSDGSSIPFPTSQAPLPSYLNDLQSEMAYSAGNKGMNQLELLSGGAGEMVNRIAFQGFNINYDSRYHELYCINQVFF